MAFHGAPTPLKLHTLATTDRRDFSTVCPAHIEPYLQNNRSHSFDHR
jgi:hypothetical protein